MAPAVYYLRMHANPAVSEPFHPPLAKWRPAFGDETPIVREVTALQEALTVVMRDGVGSGPARAMARKALAHRSPSPHLNRRLNEVITTSLRMIAGDSVPQKPLGNPSQTSAEEHLIETASLAWLGWASGQDPGRASREVARLQETPPESTGALHRATLSLWLSAIERLADEDLPEARRLWKRAIEIGSSLGTESHPAILWSYAASFFP